MQALIKDEVQIPARRGQRLYFKKPTISRVSKILRNPAYTGTYVFGITQSQPGGPVLARGQSKRIVAPEERWVKRPNNHPAYMTVEEQEEIKSILEKNSFGRRNRAGRGPALSQGLLRCAVCGGSLSVSYNRHNSYGYMCGKQLLYGEKACTSFVSKDFDQHILQEVFKVLKAPPIEMLRSSLEKSRRQKQSRASWIQAERERLAHEERMARARADLTHDSLRLVHLDALERLEKVLAERERFERKVAMEPLTTADESTEELEALCRVVSQVPTLWHDPAVTNQERKEILRCVIDHVVVTASKERIDATIIWKSGKPTPIAILRPSARDKLICELHAQKLTVLEIIEHLAAGKTSTGEIVNITRDGLYNVLGKFHLKAHRVSRYRSLRPEADELNRAGRSLEWIAQYFDRQSVASASGKSWTPSMVKELLRRTRDKAETLENIHRNAIVEALGRGLDFGEIATEFNQKNLRRKRGSQPWTARSIRQRLSNLQQLQRSRARRDANRRGLSEAVTAKKSA